ncbi:hypothetical protein GA0115233_101411 [Streptomyces sp. DI166]|nr:hypothetical protein GA0115233_101411 [Streptomyces sp. DI166]
MGVPGLGKEAAEVGGKALRKVFTGCRAAL